MTDSEIVRGGPTYTVDTVRELVADGHRVTVIVGADAAGNLDEWHDADWLRTADHRHRAAHGLYADRWGTMAGSGDSDGTRGPLQHAYSSRDGHTRGVGGLHPGGRPAHLSRRPRVGSQGMAVRSFTCPVHTTVD